MHRDIKPSNLLITHASGGDSVKLADFGLARAYQASGLSGLTMTGEISGTIAYMSPEQITDFRRAQPATDQYAAAATLYFLLTGRFVHDFPDDPGKRLLMILDKEPVPIRDRRKDIPKGLAAAIHRCWLTIRRRGLRTSAIFMRRSSRSVEEVSDFTRGELSNERTVALPFAAPALRCIGGESRLSIRRRCWNTLAELQP